MIFVAPPVVPLPLSITTKLRPSVRLAGTAETRAHVLPPSTVFINPRLREARWIMFELAGSTAILLPRALPPLPPLPSPSRPAGVLSTHVLPRSVDLNRLPKFQIYSPTYIHTVAGALGSVAIASMPKPFASLLNPTTSSIGTHV